ncbi:MAG: putative toxin-antitoxin system toxin component, PIN family [Tepidiformaceae bacterium]
MDANCLVSGTASPNGAAGRVLRNVASGRLRLVLSEDILADYRAPMERLSVLRLFLQRNLDIDTIERAIRVLAAEAVLVTPVGEPPDCRDPDDRAYLHCALAGDADFLVTRDNDLLVLERIGACVILDPAALLDLMRAEGDEPDP